MGGIDRRRRSWLALVSALVSCGPSVVLVEDDAGTTGVVASTSTGTSRPPDPVTTGSTIQTSADDDGEGTDSTGAIGASTSTGEPGDAEGCGFLCDVDAGAAECDLFAQNCPPGEKCMPWASESGPWNATRCSPVADEPTQVGEACMVEGSGISGVDDCDVGLMCWNVDELGTGTCEDMCSGSLEAPICEDPEDFCATANLGVVALCLRACHPLLQDCAVQGEACYPQDDEWACAPDAGDKTGEHGGPCEYINACVWGNACIDAAAFSSCASATGCCSTLCDLEDENADAMCQALDPAQTCEPWYAEGQAPVGYGNVGVCMIAGAAP
jgi:hypothetical protein